jgi:hypothetical protein
MASRCDLPGTWNLEPCLNPAWWVTGEGKRLAMVYRWLVPKKGTYLDDIREDLQHLRKQLKAKREHLQHLHEQLNALHHRLPQLKDLLDEYSKDLWWLSEPLDAKHDRLSHVIEAYHEELSNLRALEEVTYQRLQKMKIRQRKEGINTPPEVLMEIEELENKIEQDKVKIRSLESSIEHNGIKLKIIESSIEQEVSEKDFLQICIDRDEKDVGILEHTINRVDIEIKELETATHELTKKRIKAIIRAKIILVSAIIAVITLPLLFFSSIIWSQAKPLSTPSPTARAFHVSFIITIATSGEIREIPPGSDTPLRLMAGSAILIETKVTSNQALLPSDLTYRYTALKGNIPKIITGHNASYVAPQEPGPDVINVSVTDQATGESTQRSINIIVQNK